MRSPALKQILIYGIIYLAVYCVLFIQFPLRNSLPGELDSIANLAMFNELKLYIHSGFHFNFGTSNYPEIHTWKAFGADFGIGILYVIISFFGFNDIWSYWLFISILFALNSVAFFYLCRFFLKDTLTCFLVPILFSFSQFSLGNLDNPNTLVFFLLFLSLSFYVRYTVQNNLTYLIISFIISAIQIYFTPYVFMFNVLILIIFVLFDFLSKPKRVNIGHLVLASIVFILLTAPYVYFIIVASPVTYYANPVSQYIQSLSLNLDDLTRVLPGNLLFNSKNDFQQYPWISNIKSAYLGLSLWTLFIIGVAKAPPKYRRLFLLVFFAGFILSLGPSVSIFNHSIFSSPLYLLLNRLHITIPFRLPVRAFFISVISISIFVGYAIQFIRNRYRYGNMLIAFFLILFIIENVSFPLQANSQRFIFYPDNSWLKIVSDQKEARKVVLHLPSNLFTYEGDQREYIYMYWRTKYKQNSLNGSLGFLPIERLRNDSLMRSWEQKDNLLKLVSENNVDLLIYHKDLVGNDKLKKDSLINWNDYPFLVLLNETPRTSVFKVYKGSQ